MDATQPGAERDETPVERADRNWNELLQELRVTQTGIQILSGFLLSIPFQSRFTDLDSGLVTVYLAAVASGTLATMLVVAPVPLHRTLFRRHVKRQVVDAGDAMAKAGLAALALTVILVTALVFGFVLGTGPGVAAAGAGAVIFFAGWLVVPLVLRARGSVRSED